MPGHANFGVVANAGNGRRWKKLVGYVENGLLMNVIINRSYIELLFSSHPYSHKVDHFWCTC